MKTTLLFATLLALAMPAFAAEPVVNPYAATIAPLERFDSGMLSVERHGNKGRP